MKIAVVGAEAVGGMLGARLARAGHEVTIIARGVQLAAIREHGCTLIEPDGTQFRVAPARVRDRMADVEAQELVLLALKAHQLGPAADGIATLIGPDTVVVTLQNGIPWWYFHGIGGAFRGIRIEAVDPRGLIESRIDSRCVLGAVLFLATEVLAPGVIRHAAGTRIAVGELEGSVSDRARGVSAILQEIGSDSPILEDIRSEIWLKLWGNLCFNPISALAGATIIDIASFPVSRNLIVRMMEEARSVAEALGFRLGLTIEQPIAMAEEMGPRRTSMLHDVESC